MTKVWLFWKHHRFRGVCDTNKDSQSRADLNRQSHKWRPSHAITYKHAKSCSSALTSLGIKISPQDILPNWCLRGVLIVAPPLIEVISCPRQRCLTGRRAESTVSASCARIRAHRRKTPRAVYLYASKMWMTTRPNSPPVTSTFGLLKIIASAPHSSHWRRKIQTKVRSGIFRKISHQIYHNIEKNEVQFVESSWRKLIGSRRQWQYTDNNGNYDLLE